MQTTHSSTQRTHWLAGMLAVALTAVSFGAQVILADHYAQAGANAGGSTLASRTTPAAAGRNAENPAVIKTASQQATVKSSAEKLPAS